MAEVRVLFKKTDEAVFISHLDISRLFIRALKRAGIKVKYTNGFNPHAYIVFAIPLSLGYESVCELVDFEVISGETDVEIANRLNEAMPGGIEVLECRAREGKLKDIGFARWDIIAEAKEALTDEDISRISELFARDEVNIIKETKRGQSEINLIDKARGISAARECENAVRIDAALSSAPEDILNPEYVIRAIRENLGLEFYDIFYTRKAFYYKNMEIFR